MSRDYRDKRGGHYSARFMISEKGHAEFARECRRSARRKAKIDLRRTGDPAERYPVERMYYD